MKHACCCQDIHVSDECRDLLQKVLVADPAQRLSMEELKRHEWFLRGLPPGALEMNEFLMTSDPTTNDVSAVLFAGQK